jgi:hypothetical protein
MSCVKMIQKQTRKQRIGRSGTGSEIYIYLLKCAESGPAQAAIVMHTRLLNHTRDLLEGI